MGEGLKQIEGIRYTQNTSFTHINPQRINKKYCIFKNNKMPRNKP